MPCNTCFALQELTYPEFCATLVRLAQLHFFNMEGLHCRLRRLITAHLLPLLESTGNPCAVASFLATPAAVQYLQSIDAVLRLVFCIAAQQVLVRSRLARFLV